MAQLFRFMTLRVAFLAALIVILNALPGFAYRGTGRVNPDQSPTTSQPK